MWVNGWLLSCFLLGSAPDTSAAPADRWAAFRGAGNSRSTVQELPLQWGPAENIAWQVKLPGYGQSSPVVWGQEVYVTAVLGDYKQWNVVVALDLSTGQERWRQMSPSSLPYPVSTYVSKAAPTPAVDEHHIYTFFESGDLLALNRQGEVIWRRNLLADYGPFRTNHGLGGSIALTATGVITLLDHSGPSWLLSFDKQTGSTQWQNARPSRVSWTSPIVQTWNDTEEVIVSSNGSLAAYKASDGSLLWERTDLSGNTVASASVAGDLILVGAAPGRGENESTSAPPSNWLLRQQRNDAGMTTEVVWKAADATSNFGSPLLYQDCAYFINRTGVLFCLDVATGKSHYTKRLRQSCWASPVGAAGRVYLFGDKGTTTVLAAGPEYQQLAENPLWTTDEPAAAAGPPGRGAPGMFSGPKLYGVAVVEGAILIRTGDTLFAVGTPGQTTP